MLLFSRYFALQTEAMTDTFFSVMTIAPLDVSTATAERVAAERWGITASARALTGERDRNFHMRADDGREFVLKFANPAEAPAVTDMQIAALRRIQAADADLPVPRIVPLPDGAMETPVPHETGGVQRVRLLSWLPGVPLHASRRNAAQRAGCGAALARTQLALARFAHPAKDQALIWDMQHVMRLRDVADALVHPGGRAMLDGLLDEFDARVTPALPTLRRQVLHNDMNGGNTLVRAEDHGEFAGLIDFGDMVETALAIDVATAMPAQLGEDMSAGAAFGHFLRAFCALQPLRAEEVALLPLLTAMRIAMSLVLQSWHRRIQPDNPHYAPVTDAEVERRLAQIAAVRAPETEAAIWLACGMPG